LQRAEPDDVKNARPQLPLRNRLIIRKDKRTRRKADDCNGCALKLTCGKLPVPREGAQIRNLQRIGGVGNFKFASRQAPECFSSGGKMIGTRNRSYLQHSV